MPQHDEMVMWSKQHQGNIWSWIHGIKKKRLKEELKKSVAYKKSVYI